MTDHNFFLTDGAYFLLNQPIFYTVTVMGMWAVEDSHPLLFLDLVVADAATKIEYINYISR